jgi:hypothetical protein
MSKNNDTAALIIGAALMYLFLVIPSPMSEQETIYLEFCHERQTTINCPTYYSYTKLEYKVFPEQQMVLIKAPQQTLKACIVYDKHNWRCEKGIGTSISVTNSRLLEINHGNINLSQLQISSFHFYLFNSLRWLGFS